MSKERSIIITGGAGFIGSHVVRLFVTKYPEYRIINVDKLTYAGNLENLRDVENAPNYRFVKADVCDFDAMLSLMREERVDGVIHLAAESHVDRSIKDPFTFARTNVLGTLSLLQAARLYWESLPAKYEGKRFYHISTDEVYGALEMNRPEGADDDLITYVTDRAGHDLRYAIDSSKLKRELGWEPSLQFEEGIEKTVRWYLDNQEWMDRVTSGEYEKYYEQMYKGR